LCNVIEHYQVHVVDQLKSEKTIIVWQQQHQWMYVLISISILCDHWVYFVQENLSSQQETVKEDEEHHSVTVLCASNEVYAVSQVKKLFENVFFRIK